MPAFWAQTTFYSIEELLTLYTYHIKNVNLPKEEKFMQVKYDRKLLIAIGRSQENCPTKKSQTLWG